MSAAVISVSCCGMSREKPQQMLHVAVSDVCWIVAVALCVSYGCVTVSSLGISVLPDCRLRAEGAGLWFKSAVTEFIKRRTICCHIVLQTGRFNTSSVM